MEREEDTRTGVSGVGRADASILAIRVALGLTDKGIVVFGLEGAELQEQEDLWELLADPIGLVAASILATL